jgi:type I restriction enzyme, S subunit
MDRWRTIKLDEGLDRLIDYRGKSPPKSSGGTPVISAKCVKDGRIVQPVEQAIEPNFYPIWMVRGLPLVGDVIMTTEGPLGEIAQIDKETVQFALGQRVVCMRGRRGVLDNSFLKFLLMSPIQQGILSSYSTGTTVAGISQKSLRSMPVRIPPYDEQVEIGQLLGALDDKINLNRRMNGTLEAMARAIFKDWFVDFGPTLAKMEGSAPYLAPNIWALFPDRLDDGGGPRRGLSARWLTTRTSIPKTGRECPIPLLLDT